MRAADDGWAARFLGVFTALSLFRFDSESQLQPIAANAHRWAAAQVPRSYFIVIQASSCFYLFMRKQFGNMI
jgi:hypothetical protein